MHVPPANTVNIELKVALAKCFASQRKFAAPSFFRRINRIKHHLLAGMTAARLSPAASLLRNSKLFSLPPTLALPTQEASSTTLARSDTATTPYPIRAAIETPEQSLRKGDWGLKRSLPTKTTTKTGTPVIRVQRGLDTPEHIVDFESAADHVLTLQKWQHLHLQVQYPANVDLGYDNRGKHGVFNPSDDNTTDMPNQTYTGIWPSIAPEDWAQHVPKKLSDITPSHIAVKMDEHLLGGPEPPVAHERPFEAESAKRWRYKGPWLAGMSGMEFDKLLKTRIRKRKEEFRARVEAQWLADKKAAKEARDLKEPSSAQPEEPAHAQRTAVPEVKAEAPTASEPEVDAAAQPKNIGEERPQWTPDEFDTYVRALRRRPQVFGPLIAEFLDLPDGPQPPTNNQAIRKTRWEYGRETAVAPAYRNMGPPRTHPSAGLSYSRSRNWAANDGTYGPQKDPTPVVGRVLRIMRSGSGTSQSVGVAGFVTPKLDRKTSRGNNDLSNFEPTPGGQKLLVVPSAAMVNVDGKLNLHVRAAPETHVLENDEAIRQEAREMPETSRYGRVIPQLDTNYKKADPLPRGFQSTRRSSPNQEEDAGAVLDMLSKMQREQ